MITRKLRILVLALGALSTAAGAQPFRIASASLNVRVDHPFSVVVLTTDQVKGVLQFDPMDPAHSPGLEVEVATASLCSGTRLGQYVARQLQPDTSPHIVFHSTQAETLAFLPEQKPVLNFDATFRGSMRIAGGNGSARVMLKCHYDKPAVNCQVSSRFPISDMGLTVPHILWVKAKDEVKVDGEAYFAPQEGTP